MKKGLFLALAVFSTTASFLPVNYANANESGALPYISGNHNFPPNRWHVVRHTFEIKNPKNSKQISQIIIQVPEVVRWSNNPKDIVIADGNGKKVNADVTIKDKAISLAFAEPIASNSQLEIDIKKVKRVTQGNGPVYRLFAKFDGSDTATPIGIARFCKK
ncbi:hypothetical protein DSM106972_066050 [Dulcicalothrix desertica PCC 7102]|uniref:DUF2808 domain-containing protein n=1 Tax=Dulcicalothrix desertica PCC 7102 TaxID=232991 RepID=A0A433V5Y6_9CYAN|nr:DUF2808 domain-containing protein [Dulcicalothrix desertica]RUT01508.1 hypothetical protein DSM106972_066050 [Dulcicalothrix desertica PCC 7102]